MPSDLLPLEQSLAASWPAENWRDISAVVAVSGGADSVALTCAMAKLKSLSGGRGRLIVAHFNHHLRPDSDQDAEFVRALAERLALNFELGSAEVAAIASERGDGIESAARQARYDFLLQTAERLGARYVATAHTADDQIETTLFNVLRGTGLAGLAGIPRARQLSPAVTAIRPMLEVRRTEVVEYLDKLGQQFRTDPTNQSVDFTRNSLRHELLPQLRDQYRFDVDRSLLRLANIAGDAQQLIERLAEELLDRCLSPSDAAAPETVRINAAALENQDRHLVREMFVTLWRRQNWPLQAMGFEQWELLADLAQKACKPNHAPPDKLTLPGHITGENAGDGLIKIIPHPAQQFRR